MADERTQHERMASGDLYLASDPKIEAEQTEAHRVMEIYNSTTTADKQVRRELLERLVGSVGKEVEIRSPLYVDYGSHITVGDRTFVNFGLLALDVAKIVIGDDCQIGPNVQLLTPTHPIDPELRREKWEAASPITIGNNVWLGGGVIVLPGVTIGDNSVVGAGSVVTRNIPSNVVAVGNPARVLKQI
jgi:maltose O-acetyltransferase